MQVTSLDTAYFACISVSVGIYKVHILYYLYEFAVVKGSQYVIITVTIT